MRYFEVLIADGTYHGDVPLTYSYASVIKPMSTVSVPLRSRLVTAFVLKEVPKPSFETKEIKSVVSLAPLPEHCAALSQWISAYYHCTLAEALRLFGPSSAATRQIKPLEAINDNYQSQLDAPLTEEQAGAIKKISGFRGTTILLHGETGSGKTRVYLELAEKTLDSGQSVIILTPEISLTTQLARQAKNFLDREILIIHSQLGVSQRKKLWLKILESNEPLVIVGARSALFSPLKNLGLIVVDEAHEPAYKQDQSPRYLASRVASQLGRLTGAKVVLGSATPTVTDYYLAQSKDAIVRMAKPAIASARAAKVKVIDLKDRANFGQSPYFSLVLVEAIKTALARKKQVLIYLNRRGTARLILCSSCGWQMLCPNCDIPLVYHGDLHRIRCHSCGFSDEPPTVCPICTNPDIIYRSVGTKNLTEEVKKLFPEANVNRFDSDNLKGERLDEVYEDVLAGRVDILVGTQLLAKGLDLPRLAIVGIIAADSSLGLPDFSAEERSFQLLYQIIGRVGRGHTAGEVIIQTYQPDSLLIKSAAARNYLTFYNKTLTERKKFGFPPYVFLAQLICRRTSAASAQQAAEKLKDTISTLKLPLQTIGPVVPFYARRGNNYYCQLILKAKDRRTIEQALDSVPASWQVNLDPLDLL